MPSLKCPKCDKKIEKEWHKCPNCNATLKKICKKCSQELMEEWISCPNCGNKYINIKKIGIGTFGIITLFLVGIIIANVVYMDYNVNETYIDKEPYSDTETYTAKEPYVVRELVTKNEYYVVCGNSEYPISNTSAYSDCLIVGTYLYNEDIGWFNIFTGTPLLDKYKPEYIPPQDEHHEYQFEPKDYWINFPYTWSVYVTQFSIGYPVTDFYNLYSVTLPTEQCVCTVKEKSTSIYENVTEYKNVERTRTITKYRDVEKTRTITKKAKIWDIIFGNV